MTRIPLPALLLARVDILTHLLPCENLCLFLIVSLTCIGNAAQVRVVGLAMNRATLLPVRSACASAPSDLRRLPVASPALL